MKFFRFFLLLLPFQFALNIGEGADVAVGRVIVLLLVFFVFTGALQRRSFTISFSLLSFFLFLFLFWSGFSLFWAEHINEGLRKFIFLLNIIPLFWVIQNLPEVRPLADSEKILLWPAAVVSFIGILQFAAQFFIGIDGVFSVWARLAPFLYGNFFSQSILAHNSWLAEIGGKAFFRAIAFFPDPHILGFYLAFVTPLALLSKKKLFKAFGGVFITALLLTFSRQAYIGAVGALMVWSVGKMSEKLKVKSEKFYVAIFSFALLVFSLFFTPVGSRFFSSFNLSEGSVAGRFENWNQSATLIKKYPLTGVGLGNYASHIDPQVETRTPIYAHNLYLDIAAELGIIGLIVFLGIATSAIITSFRAKQYPLFFTFVWFFTQAMFDTPLFSVHILPLFIIFLAFCDNGTVAKRAFVTKFSDFERDEAKILRHIQGIWRKIFAKS